MLFFRQKILACVVRAFRRNVPASVACEPWTPPRRSEKSCRETRKKRMVIFFLIHPHDKTEGLEGINHAAQSEGSPPSFESA